MDWSGKLRAELKMRADAWATHTGLPSYTSIEASQTVLFEPTPCGTQHGNFESASWTAINATPNWKARLSKPHSQRASLPPAKQLAARELDSSTSLDELRLETRG